MSIRRWRRLILLHCFRYSCLGMACGIVVFYFVVVGMLLYAAALECHFLRLPTWLFGWLAACGGLAAGRVHGLIQRALFGWALCACLGGTLPLAV